MTPLTRRFVAGILEEVLERARLVRRISEILEARFEFDPIRSRGPRNDGRFSVRRAIVHRIVAEELGCSVHNALCNRIKDALARLDCREGSRDNHLLYRGLRLR